MRSTLLFSLLPSLAVVVACQSEATPPPPADPCAGVNTLTAEEKAAGWELLFDGTSMSGWHGYNGQSLQGWTIEGCALKTVGTEGNYGSDLRADLATDREFTDFEISLDWKTTKGGNSGLMYGVVEDRKYDAAWKTGPEYQFIDDVGFPEKLEPWQLAGANYAMHLPNAEKHPTTAACSGSATSRFARSSDEIGRPPGAQPVARRRATAAAAMPKSPPMTTVNHCQMVSWGRTPAISHFWSPDISGVPGGIAS